MGMGICCTAVGFKEEMDDSLIFQLKITFYGISIREKSRTCERPG